jgi:hypothetical protein
LEQVEWLWSDFFQALLYPLEVVLAANATSITVVDTTCCANHALHRHAALPLSYKPSLDQPSLTTTDGLETPYNTRWQRLKCAQSTQQCQ